MAKTKQTPIPPLSIVRYRRASHKAFMHSVATTAFATGRRRNGSIQVTSPTGNLEWVAMDDVIKIREYQEVTE